MKINKYQAVWVEWLDSTMKLPVWFTTKKLIDETRVPSDRFYTFGYLVNQNKSEYIFSSSIHFDETGVIGFGQIFTIPKGCVLRMKKMNIKK